MAHILVDLIVLILFFYFTPSLTQFGDAETAELLSIIPDPEFSTESSHPDELFVDEPEDDSDRDHQV